MLLLLMSNARISFLRFVGERAERSLLECSGSIGDERADFTWHNNLTRRGMGNIDECCFGPSASQVGRGILVQYALIMFVHHT